MFAFVFTKTTSLILLPSVTFKQGGSLLNHLNTKLDFIIFTNFAFYGIVTNNHIAQERYAHL